MFLAGKIYKNNFQCLKIFITFIILSMQQISSGMFGLGNSQVRCIKSYSTAPINDVSRLNPMRLARLIWINNRTVSLMLANSSETRFNV